MLDIETLLTTFLAVITAALAILSVMKLQDKEGWNWKGRIFSVCVVLFLIVSVWLQLVLKRDSIEASDRAEQTATDASKAASNADRAANIAGRAADQATLAAQSAKQASEEATKAAETTSKLVGEVERTAAEVIRTAEPLESIELDVHFLLPMSHSYLSDYKERLDKRKGIGELRISDKGQPTRGTYGLSLSVGLGNQFRQVRKKSDYFTRDDPLFPGQDEHTARGVLSLTVGELAIFKKPISPKEYSYSNLGVISTKPIEPRQNPPDLAIHGKSPNSIWQVRVGQDEDSLGPHQYRIWVENWGPPNAEWHFASDRIHYLGDLLGAQLLLVPTGGGRHPDVVEVRKLIEVLGARLTINRHVLELSPRDFRKRFDSDGNPIWEYVFSTDRSKFFSPGV